MRLRPFVVFSVLCVACGLAPKPAAADLDAYFKKPEPAYKWEKRGEQTVEGVKIFDLQMVSQEWQGMKWTHRLQIFRPDNLEHSELCTIYNTGGGGSPANTAMGVRLARETGATYAMLFGIPNQPLYGGKTEDALVVHTWLKYLETGDESWPLHFPMAKAVLKSMDAIQEFGKQNGFKPIKGFVISGASKRGWTTWLVAASKDKRVKAIMPMVIDVLNVRAQTAHQKNSYGGFSEQIEDYSRVNMMEKLETPEGKKLMELEDPYSYRSRYTMPKLIILGTNDRYWTQDALNLYWDGLKGPKWVLYTPNSGHGLEDRERVFSTMAAFVRMIAGQFKFPELNWKYVAQPDGSAELKLSSDVAPVESRLFHVSAPTRDFREQRWTYEKMTQFGTDHSRSWPKPATGFSAIFGEAVYELAGRKFTLSTQIRILGAPIAKSKK